MVPFTRALRDDRSTLGGLVKGAVVFGFGLQWLLTLLLVLHEKWAVVFG